MVRQQLTIFIIRQLKPPYPINPLDTRVFVYILVYIGYLLERSGKMIAEQLKQWIGVELWKLPEWHSRTEIAKLIGASKSPTLLSCLEQAVREGVLERVRTNDSHNRPVIKYRITDEYREGQLEEAQRYGNR